jgi:hypothetical protein
VEERPFRAALEMKWRWATASVVALGFAPGLKPLSKAVGRGAKAPLFHEVEHVAPSKPPPKQSLDGAPSSAVTAVLFSQLLLRPEWFQCPPANRRGLTKEVQFNRFVITGVQYVLPQKAPSIAIRSQRTGRVPGTGSLQCEVIYGAPYFCG